MTVPLDLNLELSEQEEYRQLAEVVNDGYDIISLIIDEREQFIPGEFTDDLRNAWPGYRVRFESLAQVLNQQLILAKPRPPLKVESEQPSSSNPPDSTNPPKPIMIEDLYGLVPA